MFLQKSKLAGSGIFVSESLTKRRHDLLNAARDRFGVKNVWTDRGNILVKLPGEPSARKIRSLAECVWISICFVFCRFFFSVQLLLPFFFLFLFCDFFILIIIRINCFGLPFILFLLFLFFWGIRFVSFFILVFLLLFAKNVLVSYFLFLTFFFHLERYVICLFIYFRWFFTWWFNEPTFSSRRGFIGTSSKRCWTVYEPS